MNLQYLHTCILYIYLSQVLTDNLLTRYALNSHNKKTHIIKKKHTFDEHKEEEKLYY